MTFILSTLFLHCWSFFSICFISLHQVERLVKNKTGTLNANELRELRTAAGNADPEQTMDTTSTTANDTTRDSNDTTLAIKAEPGADASATASGRTTSKRGRGRRATRSSQASASARVQHPREGNDDAVDPFVARLLERNWLHRSDDEVNRP